MTLEKSSCPAVDYGRVKDFLYLRADFIVYNKF